jgi:hypothetical protein
MEVAMMEKEMNAEAPGVTFGVTTFTTYIPWSVTGHSVSDEDKIAEASRNNAWTIRIFSWLYIYFFSAHFAPTDEAFVKLPSGALKYLLHNQEILTSVLLHVISGKIEAGDIQDQMLEETLLGEDLLIRKDLIGPNCYFFWKFYCTMVDFMIN